MYLCLALFFSICFTGIVLAQRLQQCPPVLASLMPKDAVKVTGQYNSAGMIGLGFATADLPFEHICVNQTTKYPGRITFDVKHYSGEGIQIFKMQISPEEQQRIMNKKKEFESKYRAILNEDRKGETINPVKMESVSGGIILYFDYTTDCSEGTKRSKPSVHLLGVAHNDNTAINLEINGDISIEKAKAAAVEVLSNFRKADFTSLDRVK